MTRQKLTQGAVISEMADRLEVEPKKVKAIFNEMLEMIKQELFSTGAPGEIVFPIGLKLSRVEKPATKARKGRNPHTGEDVIVKAKPARTVIKARVMKKLKLLAEE